MTLVLLLLAAAAEQPPQPRHEPATAAARAFIVILKPGVGSQASWDRTQALHQNELTVTERDGQKTRVRLIEYE